MANRWRTRKFFYTPSVIEKIQPITHSLYIPFVTPRSRPQMRSSLQRFADSIPDSVIPREGCLGLNAMKLQLGPLTLITPEHIDSARKFLHDLQRDS